MAITICDTKNEIPATYYFQVQKDLESKGVTHAEMRPGAEDVVWVSKGTSSRPVSLYYVFRKGQIAEIDFD